MHKHIVPHIRGGRSNYCPPQAMIPLAALIGAMYCQAVVAQEVPAPPAPPASAASAPAPVEAPAPTKQSGTQLETVIITAEKRGTSLQKTPISVTAITGASIQEKGASNVKDLMREVPGIATKSGGAGQTEYAIRGLSSTGGSSPTVGFYLDEVPLAPPAGATGGFSAVDPDLYDLARIEVLRGPQGTLYGSSSMGGTIKLIPEAPVFNKFGGSAQVTASSTAGGGGNYAANAALNVPLSDNTSAMRVVLTKKRSSGWIERIASSRFPLPNPDGSRGDVTAAPPDSITRNTNNESTEAARMSVLIKPVEGLTITPSVLWQQVRKGAPDSFDEVPGTQTRYQVFNIEEPYSDRFTNASLKVNYDFSAASLTAVSAYTRRTKHQLEDSTEAFQRLLELPAFTVADGGVGAMWTTEADKTKQLSHELRLASRGDGPLKWLVGLYGSRLVSDLAFTSTGPDVEAILGGLVYGATEQTTITQKALFGNLSYELAKDLRVTGGLRYFTSKVSSTSTSSGLFGGGAEPLETSRAKGVTPMANISYDVSPTSLVYATVAKGFRDGGAQPPVPVTQCGADLALLGKAESPSQYGPDSVWSYELGSKNRFFDRSLIVNGALYHQRWANVQSVVTLPTCGYQYFDNTGSATATGFELETGWQVGNGLTLEQSVGYTRARYSADDAASGTRRGERLQGIPDWTASTSLRYEQLVSDNYSIMGRLGIVYAAGSAYKRASTVTLPSSTVLNARVSLLGDEFSASAFVDNLTNKQVATYVAGSLSADFPTMNRFGTIRPRTIGVEISRTF